MKLLSFLYNLAIYITRIIDLFRKKRDNIFGHLTASAYVVNEDFDDFTDFLENNKQYWDYVDDELIEAIEGWSGRDIGHYEDYLKDDYVKQQVEEGKITEEQSKVLDEKLSLYTPYFQKKQKAVR
mgnify:CR=1 FL=1